MSQDEAAECPLCMEPLELDDLSFYPCTCGYQICRFCWHRLRTDENGLCPACRKQYSEDPANFKPLSVDEMQQKAKNERKAKKQRLVENRKHLANVRVVQKNLVFVVGLPTRLACQEQLKRHECFGKFGKIHKVVVNQSTSYAGVQGPSASAYVTYFRSEDALRAIEAVNNVRVDGKTLKASLGTTKYCNHFLKGGQCPKSDCMYLHELGDEAASFTKEQMQAGKHTEYERRLHEQLNHTGGCGNNGTTNQRGESKECQTLQHQQQHKFFQKENSCGNNKIAGQRSSPLPATERVPGSHLPAQLPPSATGMANNSNNKQQQQQLSAKNEGGGSVGGGNGGRRTRHKSSECSSEEASSCEEQLQLHNNQKSPATPLSERSDSPDLERLVGQAADETPDDDDDDCEDEDDEDDEEKEEEEEKAVGGEKEREAVINHDHNQEEEDVEENTSDAKKQYDGSRTSASAETLAEAATTGCNQIRTRHGHEINHRVHQQQQQNNQRTIGTPQQCKHLQQLHAQQQQQQQHRPITQEGQHQHLRSSSPSCNQAQQSSCSAPKQYHLQNELPSQNRQAILLREDRRNHHHQHHHLQQNPFHQHSCDTPPSPDSGGDGALRNSGVSAKGVMQQLQGLNQLSLGCQAHPSSHSSVQDHLLQHQHASPHQQTVNIQQQQQHHLFQQQPHHNLQRSSSREQLQPMAANKQQNNSLVNDIELDFDPIYISRKGLADLIEREQHHPLGAPSLTHPHQVGSSSGPNPNNPGNRLANLLPFGRMPPSRPSPPGIAPLSAPSAHLPGGGHHIGNQATSSSFPPGLGGPMGPMSGLGAPPSQLGTQMAPPPDHPNSHGSPHQGMRRAPPPGFGPPIPLPPQQSSGHFGTFGQTPPPMGPPGGHPHGAGSIASYYTAAGTKNDMAPPPGSSFGFRAYSGGQPSVVIPGGVASSGHCDDLLNMKEQQEQFRQLLPSVNISFGPPPHHHTPGSPTSCGSSMATGSTTNANSLPPPPGLMGALPQQHNQRQQPPLNMLTHHSGVHGGNSLHHTGSGHHGSSGWPDAFQDPAILSSSRHTHIAQPSAATTGPATDQLPSSYF